MTNQTARAEDEAANAADAPGPNPGPNQEQAPPQESKPQAPPQPDPIAVATELRDRLLRSLADMDNLRKRTAREVAEAEQRGLSSFARDLLVVADNMRRALDAVSPELRNGADGAVKALIDGVELTERELLKAMEKNGLRQFSPQGQKFDPNVHQAMFEIPDASVPAGSVVQVVQPGYMIGERVLRPALVGVSKGGPKAAPVSPGSNDNRPVPEGF